MLVAVVHVFNANVPLAAVVPAAGAVAAAVAVAFALKKKEE